MTSEIESAFGSSPRTWSAASSTSRGNPSRRTERASTLDAVKAFIADSTFDKRSEKIDKLLESEDWADRTSRLFCEGWFGNYPDVPIMLMPKLEEGARSRIMVWSLCGIDPKKSYMVEGRRIPSAWKDVKGAPIRGIMA